MSIADFTARPARSIASGAIRRVTATLGTAFARRLFLDRKAEFWLGELHAGWSLEELRARVVDVKTETRDTRTFVLAPGTGFGPHRAGQYVSVEVEIDGVRVRRCYSIASAPGERHLSITVKRVVGGRVSGFLHEHVRPGDTLRLGSPEGDFVLPEPVPAKLLLLSGGSGVTPVMSMARALEARGALAGGDVVMLHCARSRDDVIFRRELEAMTARHARFRLVTVLDDDADGGFDEAKLRRAVPDFAERDTFSCGPPGLMARVDRLWESAGAAHRVRRERFTLAAPLAASPAGAEVTLARSGRTLPIAGAQPLLIELEGAGERPAHGCRIGICQTCRCRKKSGTVENLLTGAVSSQPDEDIQLCVSIARSNLELAL